MFYTSHHRVAATTILTWDASTSSIPMLPKSAARTWADGGGGAGPALPGPWAGRGATTRPEPEAGAQSCSLSPEPKGGARGRSPEAEPGGGARGRSPEVEPEAEPEAEPGGGARGRSPEVEPRGGARGRSPRPEPGGRSPRPEPGGGARGRSPEVEPGGGARDRSPRWSRRRSPEVEPEAGARGRSPEVEPGGGARGRSPEVEPEAGARRRSPGSVRRWKPLPAGPLPPVLQAARLQAPLAELRPRLRGGGGSARPRGELPGRPPHPRPGRRLWPSAVGLRQARGQRRGPAAPHPRTPAPRGESTAAVRTPGVPVPLEQLLGPRLHGRGNPEAREVEEFARGHTAGRQPEAGFEPRQAPQDPACVWGAGHASRRRLQQGPEGRRARRLEHGPCRGSPGRGVMARSHGRGGARRPAGPQEGTLLSGRPAVSPQVEAAFGHFPEPSPARWKPGPNNT
uniref:basic salivary proline-rich protein 4-like n=1 Tax=Nyctereutes procyonoides TaxID=34880 RepID=UPI002444EBBD|nr:basic salivary proline-rich protein 4-like [Nyctereutes procyonoides]